MGDNLDNARKINCPRIFLNARNVALGMALLLRNNVNTTSLNFFKRKYPNLAKYSLNKTLSYISFIVFAYILHTSSF